MVRVMKLALVILILVQNSLATKEREERQSWGKKHKRDSGEQFDDSPYIVLPTYQLEGHQNQEWGLMGIDRDWDLEAAEMVQKNTVFTPTEEPADTFVPSEPHIGTWHVVGGIENSINNFIAENSQGKGERARWQRSDSPQATLTPIVSYQIGYGDQMTENPLPNGNQVYLTTPNPVQLEASEPLINSSQTEAPETEPHLPSYQSQDMNGILTQNLYSIQEIDVRQGPQVQPVTSEPVYELTATDNLEHTPGDVYKETANQVAAPNTSPPNGIREAPGPTDTYTISIAYTSQDSAPVHLPTPISGHAPVLPFLISPAPPPPPQPSYQPSYPSFPTNKHPQNSFPNNQRAPPKSPITKQPTTFLTKIKEDLIHSFTNEAKPKNGQVYKKQSNPSSSWLKKVKSTLLPQPFLEIPKPSQLRNKIKSALNIKLSDNKAQSKLPKIPSLKLPKLPRLPNIKLPKLPAIKLKKPPLPKVQKPKYPPPTIKPIKYQYAPRPKKTGIKLKAWYSTLKARLSKLFKKLDNTATDVLYQVPTPGPQSASLPTFLPIRKGYGEPTEGFQTMMQYAMAMTGFAFVLAIPEG